MENQTSQDTIFTDDLDASVYEYRESLEKIQLKLSSFGLTINQCKVYIYLGKYGSRTAPDVSKVLKLPRTETYKLLAAL
ncbi:MAG: TrmB family transcriptional regulator, partial [Thaumarchaeota archaeon]|nr:TrmB family transcriptional regulator [Nitrososphaerota archaeon]